MKKYICIHGHFYQPPRENAWLETIETQDSAAPYHNWNDRITDECYGPNCVSRILNEEGSIVKIMNNLSFMSFNYGPTLLAWMELHHPRVYKRIIESDGESQAHFGGYGSAMAQVYNHIIMPLANRRDKETQILWGIWDFEHRFGRKPEGMWLAETAVDLESLDIMAAHGILFSVLAPSQAKRFRKIGTDLWHEGIDTTQPYICRLRDGRSITLFFYDGSLSQKVAFGGLLKNGHQFAAELLNAFNGSKREQSLVHIATDGETFGHHHAHGDMALAYCMNYIMERTDVQLVNYRQYMELCPAGFEVEIHENSSWSCAHGVERWRSDCGCSTGGGAGWNQKWRVPLRNSLDALRDRLSQIYLDGLSKFDIDPWEVRNEYIHVFQKRDKENTKTFVEERFGHGLDSDVQSDIIRLLEMQKQCLFMYTSCGWFFNDISGIETIQILQYASRAIQLGELASGLSLEPWFVNQLAEAVSNLPEYGTGRNIYNTEVAEKRLNLPQVAMHYAAHILFSDDKSFDVLNYSCESVQAEKIYFGAYTLIMGKVKVDSRVTLASQTLHYVLLHLGNHHLVGNCAVGMSDERFAQLTTGMKTAFTDGQLAPILDTIQDNFQNRRFSFQDLFKDEQLKLLQLALDKHVLRAKQEYEDINQRMYSLMNQMRKSKLSVPMFFLKNLSALVSIELEQLLKNGAEQVNLEKWKYLADEKRRWSLQIDAPRLNFLLTRKLNAMAFEIEKLEGEALLNYMLKVSDFLHVLEVLGLKAYLHELQNVVYQKSREQSLPSKEGRLCLQEVSRLLNLSIAKQGQ